MLLLRNKREKDEWMATFFQNIQKYFKYTMYSARAELKAEVADSYLNWLWWILDPLLFMMIYSFIVRIVFNTHEPDFPVFVTIGLTLWNFFNHTINNSVTLIRKSKGIISKVYLPKYILVLIRMFINLFKMLVSLLIVFVLMIIFQVPFSVYMLHLIPIFVIMFIVIFGLATIMMNFGVFVHDLSKLMTALLRFGFYLSGIFYSIPGRVPEPYSSVLLWVNPMALFIAEARKVLLYQQVPDYFALLVWLVIGIVLCMVGVGLVSRYENTYVKVV